MAVKGIQELKPVYLVYGDEPLLLERALRRLKDRVAEVADLDFNFDTFDGETADGAEVVAAANTLPFASERRLVVVRNVDKMRASEQAVLATYALDPAPTACVVLVATKLRRDSKLYKAVDALGGTAEYRAPGRSEYPAWVIELFGTRGRKIDRGGAEALVAAVGRDLRRLETEADKVVAYAGDRVTLTRADIEAVVEATASPSVFDFLNALGSRECGAAFGLLDALLGSGEELLGIHAMTVRHLRTLTSARALLDRGVASGAMQRELGMQEWQVRNAVAQARRFGAGELARALRDTADLEARLKSGQGEPRVVFEMWLAGVCAKSS